VLFFVTEDWYFCSHRLHLAIAAKQAGYDVTVVTCVSLHGEIIKHAGLRLIPVQLSRGGINPWKEFCSVSELIRLYRQVRPDIVHQVALKPVLYGSIAARLSGVRHIVNALTGLGFVFSSSRTMASLLRPCLRFALRRLLNQPKSRMIVQNPDDYRMLVGERLILEGRVALIRGSGVDIDCFTPMVEPANVPIVFTFVGRMLQDKGVEEFVDAVKLLRQQGEQLKAVLVGQPDQENPGTLSETQIQAWHSGGHVEWWGQRNDIPNVWAQSHVAVLPSYREGLPKSLLEAAACARPLISCDVPGCREIVHHKENGLLVPARNVNALADAMRTLLHDQNMRQRMGKMGRLMVENDLSNACVAEQTLRLYREICEKGQA